jgi:hypothetical protein
MVRWFKMLFRKRQPELRPLLFNVGKVEHALEQMRAKLLTISGSDTLKLFVDLLEAERNLRILSVHRLQGPSTEALAFHQGQIRGLESILIFIEESISNSQYSDAKPAERIIRLKPRATTSEAVI